MHWSNAYALAFTPNIYACLPPLISTSFVAVGAEATAAETKKLLLRPAADCRGAEQSRVRPPIARLLSRSNGRNDARGNGTAPPRRRRATGLL